MKDRKNQITTNNEGNLQADALIDLPVDEARQDEVKGGLGQVITYTYTVTNTSSADSPR